ncbi:MULTISPECIES: Fic family protein [unclassified Moraxella]|uniref:Fic family protein n=1 Tax=unclassified Moraxella TaxID=2685852 RepID=UPI003AF55EAF
MNYNPNHLDYKPILTEAEKTLFEGYRAELSVDYLLANHRNLEEIGIDFVYSSAKLEGNTYDQFDTLTLLKMGQTAGGKLYSDAIMLLNLREAFTSIINALDNDEMINLKSFIKDQHAMITDKLVVQSQRGVVRNSSVTIGGTDYQPLSSSQKLDEELNYLLTISEKYSHPVERALYLHNNLDYLQYFIDGNKRTARNTLLYILMQAGFFPIIFHVGQVTDYAKSIVNYYETGDYGVFKQYFMDTYQKTIERYRPKPDVEFTRT